MIAVGPISFLVMALAALLWAAGVLPSALTIRLEVAALSVYIVNAAVMTTLVLYRKRRHEREAVAQAKKLRDSLLDSLVRNDYVLGIADGEIKAGDLVKLENGKVKTVTRLADIPEGKIQ